MISGLLRLQHRLGWVVENLHSTANVSEGFRLIKARIGAIYVIYRPRPLLAKQIHLIESDVLTVDS